MPDQSDDYRDSLLFRYCKTEEVYRAVLARQEQDKRREQQAWRRLLNSPLTPTNEGPPPATRPAPPTEPTDKMRVFMAYLESACRDYPDRMRDILAPLLLDILEEYQTAED